MKISHKITSLILFSVASLIIISIILSFSKAQEIRYYTLVEGVKNLHGEILEALVNQKNFERSNLGEEKVFEAIDNAQGHLNALDFSLLEESDIESQEINSLIDFFRSEFQKMTVNSKELADIKGQINELSVEYSNSNDEVSQLISDKIANAFLYGGGENDAELQELKNMSLAAFTQINRIVLLVSQDLLLEGNVDRFAEKYQPTVEQLGVQENNIKLLVEETLTEFEFEELSELLTETYTNIQELVSQLRVLYDANQKISSQLQENEQKISNITTNITSYSEELRTEQNVIASRFQLIGQGVVVVILLTGGILIARSITSPLSILTNTTENIDPNDLETLKAKNNEEEDKILRSKDELGILSRSFDKMRASIVEKIEVIEEYSRTLEDKVKERTAQLQQKTNDVNNMLQNLPEGVMTIIDNGVIHPEYSKHLEVILETDQIAGEKLMDLIFSNTDLGADTLSQIDTTLSVTLGEDSFMWEMNSHALPSEFQKSMSDGRHKILEVGWNPIENADDEIEKVLVTIRDVTELRSLQAQAKEQQRELQIIQQILNIQEDKFSEFMSSANNFWKENEELIKKTDHKEPDVLDVLFRNMHTIKGNARTYGLLHLTQFVHEVEQEYDQLRKSDLAWDQQHLLEELNRIKGLLGEYMGINVNKLKRGGNGAAKFSTIADNQIQEFMKDINSVMGTDQTTMQRVAVDIQKKLKLISNKQLEDTAYYKVPDEQLDDIIKTLTPDADDLLKSLQLTHTKLLLIGSDKPEKHISGIINSLPGLAAELGKESPQVNIDNHDVYVKQEAALLLQNTCTHLFRNSIDHGIEMPEVREGKGKNRVGCIDFEVKYVDDTLHFYLQDDGQGLDLDRIRNKALENKLITEDDNLSPEEIAQLIFLSGLSTAEKTTEVSGRGVGMDAVKKFIEKEGGSITIEFLERTGDRSQDYQPIRFHFTLPGSFAVVPTVNLSDVPPQQPDTAEQSGIIIN